MLGIFRSSWLVDYAVFVFVFNRGLRRVIDYYINGTFNPFSPISVTPLVVAGVMAAILVLEFRRLSATTKKFFALFLITFAFSLVVGLINVQLAAVYALAEVLAPLGLAGYVLLLNPPDTTKDRWVRSFSWGAILVSAYGWFQYLTIPPWDAFWLVSVNLVGYMGIPEPTQMTVFSTMAERGVVAGYLGYSVVPMIVSPRWRTIAGWPGVILVFSALLLTLSRGGLIIAGVATLIFVILNRGARSGQIMIACGLLSLSAIYGVKRIPNAERIMDRFESLKNMQEDGSYIGRTEIMENSVSRVFEFPFGLGLGAGGMGTRVNTGTVNTASQFGDGGYFDVLLTYGIPGTLMLVAALGIAWKAFALRFRFKFLRSEHVLLARALLVSLSITCFAGNFLTGFSVLWLAIGCAFALPLPVMKKIQWLLKSGKPVGQSDKVLKMNGDGDCLSTSKSFV